MPISAIYGLPGKGKSLFATFYGIYLANKYEKKLVLNYYLNPIKLAYYCKLMGYQWLFDNLNKDTIYYASTNENFDSIMAIEDSVILWDEVGIYLPSRGSTHSTPKKLLVDLCQVRHSSQYLIWMAQSEGQVDIALRNLTEEIFHCNGISRWCNKLRNEKLYYKTTHRFNTDTYRQWLSDPKIQKNPIKTKILANKSWTGFLTCADLYLFDVYSSFKRLEKDYSEEIKSDILHYSKPEKPGLPCIQGYNPIKMHKFGGLIRFLFTKLPFPYLQRILNLDKKLSGIVARPLTDFEKQILKGVAAYVLALFGFGMFS